MPGFDQAQVMLQGPSPRGHSLVVRDRRCVVVLHNDVYFTGGTVRAQITGQFFVSRPHNSPGQGQRQATDRK